MKWSHSTAVLRAFAVTDSNTHSTERRSQLADTAGRLWDMEHCQHNWSVRTKTPRTVELESQNVTWLTLTVNCQLNWIWAATPVKTKFVWWKPAGEVSRMQSVSVKRTATASDCIRLTSAADFRHTDFIFTGCWLLVGQTWHEELIKWWDFNFTNFRLTLHYH